MSRFGRIASVLLGAAHLACCLELICGSAARFHPAQHGAEVEPDATLDRVADFLGRPAFPRLAPKNANARQCATPLRADEWDYLSAVYAEEIAELERLLGWDCSQWRQWPS